MNIYNPLAAYSDYNDEEFCKKLGITDNRGLLTYAGLLMLGRTEIIHQYIPTFWIDYIEIPGDSIQEAQTDIRIGFLNKRTYGNIITSLSNGYGYLPKHPF